MAEGDDGQEKTEEPSQKKKDDARKQGQVVTSKEMFVFAGMAAGTLMLVMSRGAMPSMAADFAGYFQFEDMTKIDTLVTERLSTAMWQVWLLGIIVGLPLLLVTLGMQAATGGLNFATEALGFKFNKLNPLSGMARMVSMKALVELVKAVLKVTLLIAAAYAVLEPVLHDIPNLAWMSAGDASVYLGNVLIRLLAAMTLGLGIIGGIDLFYQIYSMMQQLRMSRQELKDEYKESEGSPEQKAQIRRRQGEAARNGAQRRKALEDVPNATAIITNPTHFAVALRYIPGEMRAPVILAMGKGPMALDIMERGKKAQITVLQVPPLARALYFTGDIGAEISEHLYSAVAVILAHIYRLDRGMWAETPDIDLPEELRLDEFGRQIKGEIK